jgi:hypothetical protein
LLRVFSFSIGFSRPFQLQSPPLAGLPFAFGSHFGNFLCLSVLAASGGGAYRFAVGGKVFNRSHAQTKLLGQFCLGAGEPPHSNGERENEKSANGGF